MEHKFLEEYLALRTLAFIDGILHPAILLDGLDPLNNTPQFLALQVQTVPKVPFLADLNDLDSGVAVHFERDEPLVPLITEHHHERVELRTEYLHHFVGGFVLQVRKRTLLRRARKVVKPEVRVLVEQFYIEHPHQHPLLAESCWSGVQDELAALGDPRRRQQGF